jgi:hypothetical protein
MKLFQFIITAIFLTLIAAPCFAQKDAKTASARAAYSTPSSGYNNKAKKKDKAKKQQKARKARRSNTANVLRKSPVGL